MGQESDRDEAVLEKLDLHTLTNLLLNPRQRVEVQRRVLSIFAGLPPSVRTDHVARVLAAMIAAPAGAYHTDLMMSVIDLLATDPAPEATKAMLDVLPQVARSALQGVELAPDFRDYFYQALATRRRESDAPIWRERLPRLDADTLVALLLDPHAKAMHEVLDPFKLIDRLPAAPRRRALTTLILRADARQGWRALRLLLGGRAR